MIISIYRISDGRIDRVASVKEGREDAACLPGESWLLGDHDDGKYRVDLDTMQVVPLMTFDPVIETNRISNIPEGSTALFAAMKAPINDGFIELSVEYPELISVLLTHPLYQPKTFEVPCAPL